MALQALLKAANLTDRLSKHHLALADDLLWDCLLKEGVFTLSELSDLIQIELTDTRSIAQTIPGISEALKEEGHAQGCVFLGVTDQGVYLATPNPYLEFVKTLSDRLEKPVFPLLLSSETLSTLEESFAPGIENLELDLLIRQALGMSASDIHLFCHEEGGRLCFRLHGNLKTVQQLSHAEALAMVDSLKFHSHMDVSKRRLPQDGRFTWASDAKRVDCRVSSLPTVHGEDMVVRLMGVSDQVLPLSKLGLSAPLQKEVKETLALQSGLILVTGATGSGKSTSLYAFLDYIQSSKPLSIVTLEDPVEHILPGVRQSQINADIGYTFTAGLKAVLRQDPDVIMIGEIRDAETAKIALDAAYTGHLVLASLHTNDVLTSLHRLSGFGLDPFLVSQCLKGVLSQRLVPAACRSCAGSTCAECHGSGVRGRVALCEFLRVTERPAFQDWRSLSEAFLASGWFRSFESERDALIKSATIKEGYTYD